MAESSKEFARLLTEGIRGIHIREPQKLTSVIQKELGRALGRKSGSAIEYWRKGHIPSKQSDVEKLAREIVSRSDLEREWLRKFLESSGYQNLSELCDELFPPVIPSHIPSKLYRKLVGRDVLVDDILVALRDPDGRWIVTVDGMGGIGKTALAREVADRCLKKDYFSALVWANGPRKSINKGEHNASVTFTFETVLNTIAHQLDVSDVSHLKAQEKETRVQELLRNQPVLVVLDNLETSAEPQNEIARRLRPMLNPSKGLLLSRHRFKGDIYPIHLTGLDKNQALEFICQEAGEKRVRRIETASPGELQQIVKATGGSPLAMKLVVGQLGHLPLNAVLEHLQKVTPLESKTDEDDYVRFYKYIYFPSWELLSDAGEQLLISMALFVPGVGGSLEAISATSGLAEDALIRHVHELWQLSLLEVAEASKPDLEQVHYYLHALTKHFVLSEIVQALD